MVMVLYKGRGIMNTSVTLIVVDGEDGLDKKRLC